MRRLLLLTVAGLAVASLLAACGGGGGGGGGSGGQVSQAQAFTDSVNQVAAKTADDTEPEDDATTTVAVDDTVEADPTF